MLANGLRGALQHRLASLRAVETTFHDTGSYLAYARARTLNPRTTVFRGTLYELTTRDVLQRALGLEGLVHTGGSYDNGLDLLGGWGLGARVLPGVAGGEMPRSQRVLGGSVTPLVTRGWLDRVRVMVQCKAITKSMAATTIRELAGTFQYLVRKADRDRTFFFLAAPVGITPQGMTQMNRSPFPIIYVRIEESVPLNPTLNQVLEYSESNYLPGRLLAFYGNPYATALLEGLSVESDAQRWILDHPRPASTE